MCIICNCPDHENAAEGFLTAFDTARRAMQTACDRMLDVSKIAATPDDRKRYDMIHKDMVRLCREWNKLEQKREHV